MQNRLLNNSEVWLALGLLALSLSFAVERYAPSNTVSEFVTGLLIGLSVAANLVQVIQKLDEGNQRLLFKDETAAKVIFAEWRSQAEGYLAGVAARVTAAGIVCDYRVAVDNPDHAICAMSNHADLIVMGTHGRGGLSRWVYGSVVNKVLRGASCPLLLIHTKEKAFGRRNHL